MPTPGTVIAVGIWNYLQPVNTAHVYWHEKMVLHKRKRSEKKFPRKTYSNEIERSTTMATRARKSRDPPPQAIVPFDSSDKRLKEKWTAERAKDLANLPCPFRMLLLGPPGGGN